MCMWRGLVITVPDCCCSPFRGFSPGAGTKVITDEVPRRSFEGKRSSSQMEVLCMSAVQVAEDRVM